MAGWLGLRTQPLFRRCLACSNRIAMSDFTACFVGVSAQPKHFEVACHTGKNDRWRAATLSRASPLRVRLFSMTNAVPGDVLLYPCRFAS